MTNLYPPCSAPVTFDNLELFLRFSDQFDCSELRKHCEEFVIGKLVLISAKGSMAEEQKVFAPLWMLCTTSSLKANRCIFLAIYLSYFRLQRQPVSS